MEPFRFLQTSDLHLDWLFEKYPPVKRQERRKELLKAFNQIIEAALKNQVEAVLIAGDLFHTPTPGQATLLQVEQGFTRLKEAGIRAVIIPGNHDPCREGSCYNYHSFPDNVFIFKEEPFGVLKFRDGVTIYGIPYREQLAQERALLMLKAEPGQGVHIGLAHGTYKGVSLGEEAYAPIFPGDINKSGLTHLALGHYHNFKDCSQSKTTACYSGCPARLTFHNLEERVVLIGEARTGEKTSWQQFMLESRPYREIVCDLSCQNMAQVLAGIARQADAEACMRLVLKGTIPEDQLFSIGEIEAGLQQYFFYAEIGDEITVVPLEPEPDTVKGLFIKKINALLQDQGLSPEQRRLYQEALRIGLTALRGGRLP
ncbi:MAG: metallophosphoesterase family protein [Bacillota bacterium]